ncbi:MAG: hypothetical protein ACOCUI_05110, partial [bacterium]
ITSFSQIASANNQAAQAISSLGIGFTFLKFSIGEAIATALMPFTEQILNTIMAVSDWISQNQTLVAGIVLGGLH